MWVGAVLWQVGYDSIYAYVDVQDDLRLGVRSTAMRFAQNGKAWISGFYTATIALWVYGGAAIGMGWAYFAVIAVIAGHPGDWRMPARAWSGIPTLRRKSSTAPSRSPDASACDSASA